MAKQVKVFRGSSVVVTNGETIIYTVPAGRVAKITIGSLFLSATSFAGVSPAISLLVGGVVVSSISSTSGSQSLSTTDISAIIGTTTSNIHTPGAGQKAVVATVSPSARIIDSEFYLMGGDTVSFSASSVGGGNSATIRYSFSAVEEF